MRDTIKINRELVAEKKECLAGKLVLCEELQGGCKIGE